MLPHVPLKTSIYVLDKERLLPPPIPLSVIDTAVAVGEVAKRNHRSYVVAVVGAGVPQEPAVPSLIAFFILYNPGVVQFAEGEIVVATVPQVSAPGACANELIDENITSPKEIRNDKRA